MHGGCANTSQSGFQVSATPLCVGKSHDANQFSRSALGCTPRASDSSWNIALNETVRGFGLRASRMNAETDKDHREREGKIG
jgi:hypothetical protein